VVISGPQAQHWLTQDQNGVWPPAMLSVRIPAQTGQWYFLARRQSSPPYWGALDGAGNLTLKLQSPYQRGKRYPPSTTDVDTGDTNASCEVQLGNDLLAFHQPIPLPSGVVIDLDNSSPNVSGQWPATPVATNIDIMYSPGGKVSGPLSGL